MFVSGAVNKRRPQSRGGGLSSTDIFRSRGKEGFFSCGHPHFLAKKTSDFSKSTVYPHRQGGEGQFFAILCGRLLWTAPIDKEMGATKKLLCIHINKH